MNLEKCQSGLDALLAQCATTTDDPLADAQRLGAVLAMLADASAKVTAQRYTAVLHLRDSGMSLGEIGAELGIARGTVQGIVERARAMSQTSMTAASDRSSGEI